MNPDDTLDEILKSSISSIAGATVGGALTLPTTWSAANVTAAATPLPKIPRTADEIMDEHSLNRIAIDHKVSAQELLKLQEVAPDYASEIKENIAKNLARDIAKKVMYKKKHDKDTDVHHFIGRVWVFTDDELKEMLQNVY